MAGLSRSTGGAGPGPGLRFDFNILAEGKFRRYLARNIVWGSSLAMLVILLLGAGSFMDFDQLFLMLHELIFTNSYWSASGYMLLLFPGGFWYDAALICIAFMAGLAVILGLAAFAYLRYTRERIVE